MLVDGSMKPCARVVRHLLT